MNARKIKIGILLALGTLFFNVSLWAAGAPFVNGMTYAAYTKTGYQTAEGADTSLANLASTGVNWIAIIVTCYQVDINTTSIDCNNPNTPSDDSLKAVISAAKNYNLKVMLKPQVNLSNPADPNSWRGQIGTGFTPLQWILWFHSYQKMITHYAALAKTTSSDLFAIGTELEGTTQKSLYWTNIIRAVHSKYKGPLTYAAGFDGEAQNITWWNNKNIDFIGVDAYFPLATEVPNTVVPTVAEITASWIAPGGPVSQLSDLYTKFHKPILFTEIGYQSLMGAHLTPYGVPDPETAVVSQQEQYNLYQGMMNVFYSPNTPSWFAGTFWWVWRPALPRCGDETDFTPCGKLAEALL